MWDSDYGQSLDVIVSPCPRFHARGIRRALVPRTDRPERERCRDPDRGGCKDSGPEGDVDGPVVGETAPDTSTRGTAMSTLWHFPDQDESSFLECHHHGPFEPART